MHSSRMLTDRGSSHLGKGSLGRQHPSRHPQADTPRGETFNYTQKPPYTTNSLHKHLIYTTHPSTHHPLGRHPLGRHPIWADIPRQTFHLYYTPTSHTLFTTPPLHHTPCTTAPLHHIPYAPPMNRQTPGKNIRGR